jgi:hypothetical protein
VFELFLEVLRMEGRAGFYQGIVLPYKLQNRAFGSGTEQALLKTFSCSKSLEVCADMKNNGLHTRPSGSSRR